MDIDVKPCPFCGSTQLAIRKGKYYWWVECCNMDCGAHGGMKRPKANAIDAWNRRAGDGEID